MEELKWAMQTGTPTSAINTRGSVATISARQRQHKLTRLKQAAGKALWFVNSFGLQLQPLELEDTSGVQVSLSFAQSSQSTSPPTPDVDPTNEAPSDPALRSTLYLLERFGVSDEFYHELAMIHPALPRSYRVKQARKQITDTVELRRLPEPHHGACRPFQECLVTAQAHEVSLL